MIVCQFEQCDQPNIHIGAMFGWLLCYGSNQTVTLSAYDIKWSLFLKCEANFLFSLTSSFLLPSP